jgi:hypothetical protein
MGIGSDKIVVAYANVLREAEYSQKCSSSEYSDDGIGGFKENPVNQE